MSDEATTVSELIRSAAGYGTRTETEAPPAGEQLPAEVAASKGLPAEWAERLQGKDREELEADADRLRRIVAPSRSFGDADAGRGEPPMPPVDMNQLLRRQAGW
jgi:hypothetical protein